MTYKELEIILDSMILNKAIIDMCGDSFDKACAEFNEKITGIDFSTIEVDENLDRKLTKANLIFQEIMHVPN